MNKIKDKLFLETFVAGLIYHDYQAAKIKRGDSLTLVHEKINPFDKNAIRVQTKDGIKLGYIPSGLTYLLHDNRPNITRCVVKSYHPGNVSHRALYVQVFERETKKETGEVIC